jgi:AhpD family alkylhydroperoxidase
MMAGMTGLPLIEPETASGEAADLLAATQRAFGITPNLARALANSPAALRAYLGFSAALRGGNLPVAVRERIALLVAQETGCDYGLSAHSYAGTKLAGLSHAEAARARNGEAGEPLAAAALTFAAALLHGRGSVTDGELAVARGGGLSDGQLAEVVAHTALGVFTSYFAKAARVNIDWPLVRHASEPPNDGHAREEAS